MMQRKNKSRPSQNGGGYGSGYDSSGEGGARSSPSKPGAPSLQGGGGIGIGIGALTGHHPAKNNSGGGHGRKQPRVAVAKVKRNICGTQPFDKHWLNLDCCGLVCAGLTYCLHLYGIYAFGWILLPPWFSVMDEDGYRELSFGCHFHRTLFIVIAILAVLAHFKAMTTDPGAVPPDANPLPEPNDDPNLDALDNLIKGESPNKSIGHGGNGKSHNSSSLTQEMSQSSSLTHEDNIGLLEGDGGGLNEKNGMKGNKNKAHGLLKMNNHNGDGLSQAAAATAAAAAVLGGAGAAGAAAVAGAVSLASSTVPVMPDAGLTLPAPPRPGTRGRRMCRRCQAFKPPRAHHCSICKRCIIKMDHHCPWVNNCVGIGNHKCFLLFIFYTSVSCGYSFVFIVYRFFHCIGHSHRHSPSCIDHPTDLLPLVGLMVESLLFGLFTLCMMFDQWEVVITNLTHIDRLKGDTNHRQGYVQQQGPQNLNPSSQAGNLPLHMTPQYNPQYARSLVRRAGINEVFGTGRHGASSSLSALPTSRFHYTWFSPLHTVCFPDILRDDIFGYCRPCPLSSLRDGDVANSMEMIGRGGDGGQGSVLAAEIV